MKQTRCGKLAQKLKNSIMQHRKHSPWPFRWKWEKNGGNYYYKHCFNANRELVAGWEAGVL